MEQTGEKWAFRPGPLCVHEPVSRLPESRSHLCLSLPLPAPGWMYLIVRGGEIELGRELGARNLFPSSPRSPPCRARCRPRARLSKLASGPQARRARQSAAAAAKAFRPVGPGARMLVTSPPDRAPPVWELISPSIIPQMFALIPS